jgi:hypothetical protein
MDVFELHRDLISDYASYTRSFIRIADPEVYIDTATDWEDID